MPSTPWIFICPSSRGIGNALTRHVLRRTARLPTAIPILATTRHVDPGAAKAALLKDQRERDALAKRLFVVRCDVTDESTVASAAAEAHRLFPGDTHHLHLACVLPGVLLNPEKSPAQVDAGAALQSFRVNAVGQMLVAKHFFGFLPRKATAMPPAGGKQKGEAAAAAPLRLPQHATWLSMSARVGSTTDNRAGGWYSYRASKAAVNSITRSLDVQLRARAGDNAMAVAYHPGTVKTELSRDFWGGVPEEKLFSAEYAAERLVDVVCGLGVEDRGRCWDWKGTEVPP
ncbi:NAD(P)-binding protein [Trichoderma citrinoviride]|uniref:NAD(P)-binding protein n=1 Tax=Trichoderma citrinoviride TaxID=58853 RepID=A0A2T4BM23_9HYPO|nr:NAD(P)-binding protein [Trichoderma citrinoviride]PTB70365.1 NAD(P)-binding protein [Trichoderma citrinoviride]